MFFKLEILVSLILIWYAALPDVGMSSDSGKYAVGATYSYPCMYLYIEQAVSLSPSACWKADFIP